MQPFFKDFSRTTLYFQGPPTRIIHTKYKKAHSQSILIGLQGLNCLLHQLHYIFQFTCLKLIVNCCIKHTAFFVNIKPLNSLSHDLYFVLAKQKPSKNTFQATTFKFEENSRTIQGLTQKFKDFSRKNGIQGLFKDFP